MKLNFIRMLVVAVSFAAGVATFAWRNSFPAQAQQVRSPAWTGPELIAEWGEHGRKCKAFRMWVQVIDKVRAGNWVVIVQCDAYGGSVVSVTR
jgi:hypothetical protein